jgi:hypothetical protein
MLLIASKNGRVEGSWGGSIDATIGKSDKTPKTRYKSHGCSEIAFNDVTWLCHSRSRARKRC